MSTFVGIDLSLTGTGVAVYDSGTGEWKVRLIKSKGKAGATIWDKLDRFNVIIDGILDVVPGVVDVIAIEGPSFGSQGSSHHDMAGLWWILVDLIHDGITKSDLDFLPEWGKLASVPPNTLKKYVTGKGNAGKDEMLISIIKRFPEAEVTDNNTADAVGLAAVAAELFGEPIVKMPESHLTGVQKISL